MARHRHFASEVSAQLAFEALSRRHGRPWLDWMERFPRECVRADWSIRMRFSLRRPCRGWRCQLCRWPLGGATKWPTALHTLHCKESMSPQTPGSGVSDSAPDVRWGPKRRASKIPRYVEDARIGTVEPFGTSRSPW